MNDRIGLGSASPPFDPAGRHRTFGVCGLACDVVLRGLPVPNLAPTAAMRESRHRLVRPATGLQTALPRRGCQSLPVFRPRRALPGPESLRQRRAGRERTMVLSRKGRERALIIGRRSGCPPGPSARGVSRNPEGAIREACAWPDPTPPISPGPPASSPASSMTARRLSVEAPAFATAASALRAGRQGRRRSRGKRAPEPGAAAALRPARNSRTAPVPEARPPRVPQIPQLRIP